MHMYSITQLKSRRNEKPNLALNNSTKCVIFGESRSVEMLVHAPRERMLLGFLYVQICQKSLRISCVIRAVTIWDHATYPSTFLTYL